MGAALSLLLVASRWAVPMETGPPPLGSPHGGLPGLMPGLCSAVVSRASPYSTAHLSRPNSGTAPKWDPVTVGDHDAFDARRRLRIFWTRERPYGQGRHSAIHYVELSRSWI